MHCFTGRCHIKNARFNNELLEEEIENFTYMTNFHILGPARQVRSCQALEDWGINTTFRTGVTLK